MSKDQISDQKESSNTLFNLFIGFLRVGFFGFGGGPASIPLVYKEAVDKYHWSDADEFGDILAIGNTLPGPIAVKMAGYIGYQQMGILGASVAIFATTIPVVVIMIAVLSSLREMKDQPWVQGVTAAVIPVVAIMMAKLTWQFTSKAKDGLGWTMTFVLIGLSILLLEVIGIHPAIVIASLIAFALLKPSKEGDK
jgi:chromate transporter